MITKKRQRPRERAIGSGTGMRMDRYIIMTAVVVAVLTVLYLKNFEKRKVFFPSKTMKLTPYAVGSQYEDVHFSAEDGVSLNGWFVPTGQKDVRGTVLCLHGNAGNISHRLHQIRAFNRIGLDVFMLDYRGYGRSGGRPSERGIYLDAEAAYSYLVSEKGIPRDDIVLYGRSLGAAPAIYLAANGKGKLIIIDSAFTSVVDMARSLYPFLPLCRFMSVKFDNLARIGKARMPKLAIHSPGDGIVPFSQGKLLYENAPEPKTLYVSEGGHNDGILKYETAIMGAVDSFLADNGM
ncbi:MAG: alpha/beta fold hydrolase [Candidatus Omnitrophica bacterium]|nr:alpha/beta fold hydrolase [Candidatus Omnitrophota bacterium]